MTISITDLLAAGSSDDYLRQSLAAAALHGLATTSWQEGDPSLTILEVIADVHAARDASVETPFVAAGLIDWAADPSVTPEPVRGEIYTGGWLDVTADQCFDVQRLPAKSATVNVTFVNSTGTTLTFQPGTYHVQDSTGVSVYSNLVTLSIPVGSSGPHKLTADVVGGGQLVPTTTLTPIPLLTLTIITGSWAPGHDTESNAQLAARSRCRMQTLSHGGPDGAYDYYAKTIPTEDPAVVFSGLRSTPDAPVTRTLLVDAQPGPLALPDVTMYCASDAGAYLPADAYTDSADINVFTVFVFSTYVQVATFTNHGFTDGDKVCLRGIAGITGLNNDETTPQWEIYGAATDVFSILCTVTGSYSSGGTVYRVSDLDLVKRNLVKYCIPHGIIADVKTAIDDPLAIVWYAQIRSGGATQALVDRINSAIRAYIAALPIGGLPLDGDVNGVPFSGITGTIWVQSPLQIVSVHVKLGGVQDTDWAMATAYSVAPVSSLTPTLVTDNAHITVV